MQHKQREAKVFFFLLFRGLAEIPVYFRGSWQNTVKLRWRDRCLRGRRELGWNCISKFAVFLQNSPTVLIQKGLMGEGKENKSISSLTAALPPINYTEKRCVVVGGSSRRPLRASAAAGEGGIHNSCTRRQSTGLADWRLDRLPRPGHSFILWGKCRIDWEI